MSEHEPQAKRVAGDQYYNQVSETIKNVLELSTRIDERVQIMMKKQDDLEKKIDAQIQISNALTTRVSVLESKSDEQLQSDVKKVQETMHEMQMKLQEIESTTSRSESRWKGIFSFVIQIIWVLFAGYLLWKFGLQAPP